MWSGRGDLFIAVDDFDISASVEGAAWVVGFGEEHFDADVDKEKEPKDEQDDEDGDDEKEGEDDEDNEAGDGEQAREDACGAELDGASGGKVGGGQACHIQW